MDDPGNPAAQARPGCRFGWYGKLPSLGDFASRRLDAELVEAWDEWLASGLADWREQAPEDWLQAYLAGSSWRFVALPGAIPGTDPTRAHAGVLMPSVDRVGRYFPFTVLWQVDRLPQTPDQLAELLRLLHELDDLAVDALQDDWPVERIEDELARLDGSTPAASGARGPALAQAPGHGSVTELGPSGALAQQFGLWAAQALIRHWQGCVIWLSDPGSGERQFRITQGLPQGAAFSQLLGGGSPPGGATGFAADDGWN